MIATKVPTKSAIRALADRRSRIADEEASDARGQGGGSGTSDSQAGPREIRLRASAPSPGIKSREKRIRRGRERTYDIRDSEVQTLADIGTFRAIKPEDLVQYRYDGDASRGACRPETSRRQGLVHRRTTYPNRDVYVTSPARAVALSNTIGLRMRIPPVLLSRVR